jgi:hypothetical protein
VLVLRESGPGQRDRWVNRALGPPVPTGTNQTDGADDRADRVHWALVQVAEPEIRLRLELPRETYGQRILTAGIPDGV